MKTPPPSFLRTFISLSESIQESLAKAPYPPPEPSNVSITSLLQSLLLGTDPLSNTETSVPEIRTKIIDFTLCCAALASASGSTYDQLAWVPDSLSTTSDSAFKELSRAYYEGFGERGSVEFGELEIDLGSLPEEKRLVVELLPEVLTLLKNKIKESSIDKSVDGHEITAASAGVPVAYAVLAAYQFRWFVTQVEYPYLGKLCSLVVPCALTALDHWSPEVKGQGMISFIHFAKNVNSAEVSWYEDAILDACCQNIASSDEIWDHVVQMSVLLVTLTQRSNPRSSWYEKLLNEMLSHLERQPRNKERRISWLKSIEPLFNSLGLALLAHFRRIFPLFFRWMHADDDDTILLVLERIKAVVKLTWIRNSPYFERLVDELVILHKEASLRVARENIRALVLQNLVLLQQSKGSQFESSWNKHKDDMDLDALHKSLPAGFPMVV